jgi:hypothetical protein
MVSKYGPNGTRAENEQVLELLSLETWSDADCYDHSKDDMLLYNCLLNCDELWNENPGTERPKVWSKNREEGESVSIIPQPV